jgi:hypothetical protein
MLDMQARLQPLSGFPSSMRCNLPGPISSKEDIARTINPDQSTCEGGSSTDSHHSWTAQAHVAWSSAALRGEEDFFPSDHSEMPSTREPSPEPFSDTAKRYGLHAEDLFPQPRGMLMPREQTPREQTPREQAPHEQVHRYPTYSEGLSLDYLAKFPEGSSKAPVDSGLCTVQSQRRQVQDVDTVSVCTQGPSTVSQQSFDEMQRESRKLNRETTWFRVVHRGYGQVAWRNELDNLHIHRNLTIVQGAFVSEGDYVLIPEGLSVQNVVDMLTETNLNVRHLVWFKAMKRANKSRVLFKWEPFVVSPRFHEKPTLVETKAFSGRD